jgi:hypothetical protein
LQFTDPHRSKGEKITAKAHGRMIDIQGVTVAHVNDKVQLQNVQTWFDPQEMFRQIAPNGIVNKEPQTTGSLEERPGNATATGPMDEDTKRVHAEMSRMNPGQCPVLMTSSGSPMNR